MKRKNREPKNGFIIPDRNSQNPFSPELLNMIMCDGNKNQCNRQHCMCNSIDNIDLQLLCMNHPLCSHVHMIASSILVAVECLYNYLVEKTVGFCTT